MNELEWQKLNSGLRIVGILVLLALGGLVLKNKYGTPPNLEDHKLLNATGSTIADCREALIFYAEQKLGTINKSEAQRLRFDFNLSGVNLS